MTRPIDVNDLTFGCEFEVIVPTGVVTVGGYHAGRQIDALPPGWRGERDCSIRVEPGYEACEVVSPVLKGAEGLRQVKQVCDWLNAVGARVNRSTGFHVHVGWAGDPEALKRLTHYVSNFEKALFASTGTHSREEGSYCRSIRGDGDYTSRFRDGSAEGLPYNRYRVLNLRNLVPGGKNTVEFRVFAGTTNATKALGYIRLCLGIVEKAMKAARQPKWVGKKPVETSPFHRKGGEGQTELTRLFYALGWTKGDQKRVFGSIEADGLPTIEDAKRELMRLGRKYDGRDESEAAPATAGCPPTWAAWDESTWERWEQILRRGQAVRVYLPDGTFAAATFFRRYPRNLQVRLSHLSAPILVPRVNNPARSDVNRVVPARD